MRRAASGLPLYHEAVSGKTWPAPAGLASLVAPTVPPAAPDRPAAVGTASLVAPPPAARATWFAPAGPIGHRRGTASSFAAMPVVAAQAKRHFPAEAPASRAVKPWRQRAWVSASVWAFLLRQVPALAPGLGGPPPPPAPG